MNYFCTCRKNINRENTVRTRRKVRLRDVGIANRGEYCAEMSKPNKSALFVCVLSCDINLPCLLITILRGEANSYIRVYYDHVIVTMNLREFRSCPSGESQHHSSSLFSTKALVFRGQFSYFSLPLEKEMNTLRN